MQLYFLVRLKLVVSKIVLRLLTLGIWLPSGQAPGQQQHDYKQQHVGSSYKILVLYASVRFRLSQASLISNGYGYVAVCDWMSCMKYVACIE